MIKKNIKRKKYLVNKLQINVVQFLEFQIAFGLEIDGSYRGKVFVVRSE